VSGEPAVRSLARAVEVGERLCDPAIRQLRDQPGLEGAAGVAVLFGQLDRIFADEGWDSAAHEFLSIAVRSTEQAGASIPGLFGPVDGLAYATWSLSRDGSRYAGLLAKLDSTLADAALTRAEQLTGDPGNHPFRLYDTVMGLAGTGGYLLARKDDPRLREVLTRVLDSLVVLCGTGPAGPNWFTPPAHLEPGSPIGQQYPDGVFNCGLAHGIPGPLALLALALDAGIAVPGQVEAIRRAGHWLANQRVDDDWGPSWASGVGPAAKQGPPAHNAWCYGALGVARALWLAGRAISDEQLTGLALETMYGIYRRPWAARAVGHSPGLCHGVAGLLQVTARFAAETGEAVFISQAKELTDRLLGLYRPAVRTGYYCVDLDGEPVEQGGLLDGAAGAALALSAASEVEPTWDRLLLLA
jgi:hypothetical protein